MHRLAFIDLELKGAALTSLGALHDHAPNTPLRARGRAALTALDAFLQEADLIAGHNLRAWDLPWLAAHHPASRALALPAIDTLHLSVLCWPERPYHRLVKGEKLVVDALSDPVADCLSARTVLAEARLALTSMARHHPARAAFLHAALTTPGTGIDSPAYALLFDLPIRSLPGTWTALLPDLEGRACTTVLAQLDPTVSTAALAFLVAWLTVEVPGSILPGWVRRAFPAVPELITRLREHPCADPACAWCQTEHDPKGLLARHFHHPAFRPRPAAPDGSSLQERIVEAGLAGQPLYAVLPTGGGKSVCFQLPAIARHRRRGLLTVVLSPLQSLMKDQVDHLETVTDGATAIYGALTPLERHQRLEKVSSGEADLLYLSPEQLRSPTIRRVLHSREIGGWVFDEAHCLATWGHDFRTDYLYAPRFIAELAQEQGIPVPPVSCFTATSQQAVREEIIRLLRETLGQEPLLFDGGVERDNLRYAVEQVPEPRRLARVHALLSEHLPHEKSGAAVVFCATRRRVNRVAEALEEAGWSVAPYHAGLDAQIRRQTQEDFLEGVRQVIVATSAFGMGVDKPDVRLVLHHDIPGSLESYLQQAGRAGRDGLPATAILLFADADVDKQFSLSARSELRLADLQALWTALRHLPPRREQQPDGDTVELRTASAGELARLNGLSGHFDPEDPEVGTRVSTAISWLERAGLLQRDENHTLVFQGRPAIADLTEAHRRLEGLHLSAEQRDRWIRVLRRLMDAPPDRGLDASDLADLAAENATAEMTPPEANRALFALLRRMCEQRLLTSGLELSALVRHKVNDPSHARLDRLLAIDRWLFELLSEIAPDPEQWQPATLGAIVARCEEISPPPRTTEVGALLRSMRRDGLGFDPQPRSAEARRGPSQDFLWIRLRRDWAEIRAIRSQLGEAARIIFGTIQARIPAEATPTASQLVAFSLEELADALVARRIGLSRMREPTAVAESALLLLHDHRVLTLQGGLAIFRSAMSLRKASGRWRRITRSDHAPLQQHYQQRRVQVHVMHAYAQRGEVEIHSALALAHDWFSVEQRDFVKRWFANNPQLLALGTTATSHRRIVEDLQSPTQEAIVQAPVEQDILVLAGPGSGKTRVLVHRVAWLIREQRVRPRGILVVCYTRANAIELRRRLRDLIDTDARGVLVQTLHGVALRLTGRTPERGMEEADFARILIEATALLTGERPVVGLEPDEQRDALLGAFSHILVDEYQDIDAPQHALISALVGRGRPDGKQLAVFAVGDDDQNVYAFRGASSEWLRRFGEDYRARATSLLDCYRCSPEILDVAEQIVAPLPNRMKAGQSLRALRPSAGIPVRRVSLPGGQAIGAFIADRIQQEAFAFEDVAVLSPTRAGLAPVRAALEAAGIPCRWPLKSGEMPPLHRIREVRALLDRFHEAGNSLLDLATLLDPPVAATAYPLLAAEPSLLPPPANPWATFLRAWLDEMVAELGPQAPAPLLHQALWEALVTERGERALGQGVRLGTLHGAKGLEYPHVFLVEDGRPRARSEEEARRRLWYVGITRARQSLFLCQRADAPDPMLSTLSGLDTDAPPPLPIGSTPWEYATLGPGELFLDLAGRRSASDPIHARLSALEAGDPIYLQGDRLVDIHGGVVAALSREAAPRWSRELELRVVAMTVREASQTEGEWRERLRVDRWEVPILEARWGEPVR